MQISWTTSLREPCLQVDNVNERNMFHLELHRVVKLKEVYFQTN